MATQKSPGTKKGSAKKSSTTSGSMPYTKPKKPPTRLMTLKKGEELKLKVDSPKDMNSPVDILMVIPQPDGSLRIRRTSRSSPILIQHD